MQRPGHCATYLSMGKNRWEDHYTRRARQENWLARSVYKLREMDQRFNLIRAGDRLLDLGCYPGSWSQYGIEKVGVQGEVVGVDIRRPVGLRAANFRFIEADVLAVDGDRLKESVGPRNAVLSDLAPRTTGIAAADVARSMVLASKALEIAAALLVAGGHFVCKVFESEDLISYRREAAARFHRIRLFRPQAIRKRSREIYLIALGFKHQE